MRPTFSVRSAAALLQMGKGIDFPLVDGTDMRIGLSPRAGIPRWWLLKDGARKTLIDAGVKEDDIVEFEVPGAWELPLAAASWR